jgi:alkylation response protein AidB-like acyl-CoA dehydrogenase
LQERCRHLAEDFATRAAQHDRDASHPTENYATLRQEGFFALNVPKILAARELGCSAGRWLPKS